MAQYVVLGNFVISAFDNEMNYNVVLYLPEMDNGIYIMSKIDVMYDTELDEDRDCTKRIQFHDLFYHLTNAIRNLYFHNTSNNPFLIEKIQKITNVAVSYYDNLMISPDTLNSGDICTSIKMLSIALSHIDENLVPKTSALYHKLIEEESSRRFLNAKAKKIQDAWRKAYYNPSHDVCKKRLQHEFYRMTNELSSI